MKLYDWEYFIYVNISQFIKRNKIVPLFSG